MSHETEAAELDRILRAESVRLMGPAEIERLMALEAHDGVARRVSVLDGLAIIADVAMAQLPAAVIAAARTSIPGPWVDLEAVTRAEQQIRMTPRPDNWTDRMTYIAYRLAQLRQTRRGSQFWALGVIESATTAILIFEVGNARAAIGWLGRAFEALVLGQRAGARELETGELPRRIEQPEWSPE